MSDTSIEQLYKIFLSCGGVSTDSRTVNKGELFFALKGENFDGNLYARTALEAGAAYCVVSEEYVEGLQDSDREVRFLPVPDTLKALQQLAAMHRLQCRHKGERIPVMALTGTNGKTTTKELIRAVLSTKYNVLSTEGNLNNNIGVPLTILKLKPEHDIAVVEMGASHPGDIKELVQIAQPDCGLITNVGRAHLMGFGNFDGVKKTKGELYDYLAGHDGFCFINNDSEDLKAMASERFKDRLQEKSIQYGISQDKASVLPGSPQRPYLSLSLSYGGREYSVNSSLVGAYNADNILAAVAVGRHFGVSVEGCIGAIEAYVPQNNRSQMKKTGRNTLIIDAYNANPSSMAAALENFFEMEAKKKMVCLGDMLELGDESAGEHIKILRSVLESGVMEAVFVGKEFGTAMASCTADIGLSKTLCRGFDNSDSASQYLEEHHPEGFLILVKGSRGIRMEKIVPAL